MNILLVNNDAVVSKLVKLSTQKIGDRLDIATSIDEIRGENYDLLILDGALFSREFLDRLNDKVIYAHSIYITTRESTGSDLFEKHLYKPFLPTELLVMLLKVAAQVKREQEERSREIVFEDFDKPFVPEDEVVDSNVEEEMFEPEPQFEKSGEAALESILSDEKAFEVKALLDDEIFGGEDEVEQDALERVHRFEKIEEEPLQEIAADEASEEEILDNIFSEEEVSEVKAILDVLSEAPEKDEEIVEEVIQESEPPQNIDQELEAALRNISVEELEQSVDEELLMQFDDLSTEELSWNEPEPTSLPSKQNQESIETLRTLLKALENPQLARSLRGTITINLTFGEDNE